MDFRLNGTGRGLTAGAVGASEARLSFSTAQSVNQSDDKSSAATAEASVLSLSSQATTNSSSGTESALRSISDASSYLSVASSAASSIEDLLGQLGDVYTSLQNTLDPAETDILNGEAYELLLEINAVASASTFNGSSVVDGGNQTFLFSLDGESLAAGSSSGSVAVTIANVALSATALGLPDVNSPDFARGQLGEALDASDGSGAQLLASAQAQVDAVQSALSASAQELNSVANSFGLSTNAETQAIANGTLSNDDADLLTSKIISEISSVITAQSGNLDALRVADLLAPVENIPAPAAKLERPNEPEESAVTKKLKELLSSEEE